MAAFRKGMASTVPIRGQHFIEAGHGFSGANTQPKRKSGFSR
jgi:hypothetical protein